MSSVKIILLLSAFIFTACTSEDKVILPTSDSVHHSGINYMGPVEKSINLKFIKNEKTQQITAEVSLPYALDSDLSYTWKLGSGVRLISGLAEGQVSYKKANTKIHINLTVDNFFTEPGRFVRFEIVGHNGRKAIFADGVVASEIEKSFEHVINEVNKLDEK